MKKSLDTKNIITKEELMDLFTAKGAIEVDEPRLYKETFPYDDFPKDVFIEGTYPYDIPEEIWVTDTTFRVLPLFQKKCSEEATDFGLIRLRQQKNVSQHKTVRWRRCLQRLCWAIL
mgnify:CR=1 FL=1